MEEQDFTPIITAVQEYFSNPQINPEEKKEAANNIMSILGNQETEQPQQGGLPMQGGGMSKGGFTKSSYKSGGFMPTQHSKEQNAIKALRTPTDPFSKLRK